MTLGIHTYYFVTNFESGHKSCSKFINFRHNLLVKSNGLLILFSYHPVLSMTWKTYVSLLLCNPSNGPSEPFRKFLPRWYDQSLGNSSFGESEDFWEFTYGLLPKISDKRNGEWIEWGSLTLNITVAHNQHRDTRISLQWIPMQSFQWINTWIAHILENSYFWLLKFLEEKRWVICYIQFQNQACSLEMTV